jgi:serine/threonine-protein kinase
MASCPTCRTRYDEAVKVCPTDGADLLPDEAVAAGDEELAVGQVVGEYRVEGKLGEGGFGAVYRAVHPLIGKAAAIKVLHRQYSSNPQMVSRFIAEARAVNQIRNRNIIDIFSFGALEDGRQYYVMELLDGMTLDAYIKKKGRLTPEEALPILRGVARALDAAHASGIAHRDLKPENIFLLFEDDLPIPKLLDFGIAKLLGESGVAHKTRTGTPMGTPYYMSPEQCRGRNVDHRTDIYSFGVVVFEALAGKIPFDGEDVMEILVKHTTAPAPRLSEVSPGVPPSLDAPVAAFLEKDPQKRPESLAAGLDALAAAAAEAGFDVKVPALSGRKPSGDAASVSSPAVHVVGGLTPADASAKTMLHDSAGKTVLSAEAAPKPAPARTVVFGAVGAVALIAAIGIGVATRGPGRDAGPQPGGAGPEVTAPATATAAPTVTAKLPDPSVTPSATAEALPPEVELTVDSTPKVVEVWQGTTRIGSSSAAVKLKRADGKVKLTFKAAGYAPRDVDVSASANGNVSVSLVPAAGGGKKRDVEF